jgi:flagellar L-ring protein precursor FlgH
MIRFTFVVAAVYAICCAMAFGETAPVERSTPVRGSSESRGGSRAPEEPRGAAREYSSASLTENPETYAAASSMALPKKQPRTLKQHDLVTIVVNETSQSTIKGTTNLQKSTDLDAKVDSFVKLNLAKMSLDPKAPAVAPELKGEFSRNSLGDAQVDRADTFTARIQAEVLDVKPNGTLVLQARKHIDNDGEEQEFVLTGICRAEDVGPDNSILSNTLHDLDVKKTTKGSARDTTKRGGLARLLDFLNPF